MNLLDVEIADHIAVVRLNRPASRNALNAELVVRLAETWEGLSADADVRVIVLTGTGESTFCAGFDLASLIPLITGTRAPADAWDEAVQAGGGLALAGRATLRDCDPGRPIIVAANGHAIAGGFELLLAGDLRIVAAGARLGLSEVRLGLIPAMGGTARLARQMSPALAAEMLLTGNPVSAERALAAGFLNQIAPAAEVMNIAMEYARVIAANAPLAVRAAREVMRRSADLTEREALDLENAHCAALARTQDAVEGPRAFMEKRPPVFQGR